jgi:hypothetical protein
MIRSSLFGHHHQVALLTVIDDARAHPVTEQPVMDRPKISYVSPKGAWRFANRHALPGTFCFSLPGRWQRDRRMPNRHNFVTHLELRPVLYHTCSDTTRHPLLTPSLGVCIPDWHAILDAEAVMGHSRRCIGSQLSEFPLPLSWSWRLEQTHAVKGGQ